MENEETQQKSVAAAQNKELLKNRVLKIDASFGNYRVVKCMCVGLLAHYYRMQHIRDLHNVTVAIFHHRTEGDEEFLKRLEALQRTVSNFDAPAIPKIRHCTTINERTCIFLDPVEGVTLTQYFKAHGIPGEQGIGLRATARIIAQLLRSLGYAHSQGVDHRDLDSELIYVQGDGSLRILGLGIKAALGVTLFESIVSASPPVLNKTMARLNSFDVMSPEYRSGVAEDARVDVYAVGFIGYWLLTGQKAVLAEYIPPTLLIEDISPKWNSFLEQSLERFQNKRYQSCKIALLALKDVDEELQLAGAGLVRRQINRIPVPKGIGERGELAARIYRLFTASLIGLTLTAICAYFLSVSYKEKQDEQISIRGGDAKQLKVELRPAWADIIIRTTPEAAVSVIDAHGLETELGIADQEGIFYLKGGIVAGAYQVLLQKEGYQSNTLENQAIAFGTASEINTPLLPLPVNLSIQTNPSGAVIVMNDVELGTTPLSLEDVLVSDQYLVVARLEGYRPISRRVQVEPGADMTIDFGELVPLSGVLRIEMSVLGDSAPEPLALIEQLKVVMDDRPIPFSSEALDFVPVGERRIRLEHPLYISDEVTLEVEDRGHYALNLELSPKPGFVKLKMPDHLEAELRLDGQPASLRNGQIQIPTYQEVEFELRIRNYLTMVRSFKLSPNEIFEWEVEPVPIPGLIQGQSWTLPYIGIPFAWVPPGQFKMGSPLPEHARIPNEGPQSKVRFTRGFWVGVHEVTQAQYSEIMGQNPAKFKSAARPVESVSWKDANTFCELLTNIERDARRLPAGYVYRLPSEAEWEYTARAGTTTPFHFGDEADASMGHFRGIYPRGREDGLRVPVGSYGTATIGRYQANAFGLYDVHGNVREWTLDAYNARLGGESQVDPRPRTDGSRIVVKGGGWGDSAARVRSAVREGVNPEVTSEAIGFRVVLAPEL